MPAVGPPHGLPAWRLLAAVTGPPTARGHHSVLYFRLVGGILDMKAAVKYGNGTNDYLKRGEIWKCRQTITLKEVKYGNAAKRLP